MEGRIAEKVRFKSGLKRMKVMDGENDDICLIYGVRGCFNFSG